MVWHFRRIGKPTRGMALIGITALVCATLQIGALEDRPPWQPQAAFALYAASALLFWWAVAVTRGQLAACGQGYISTRIITRGPYRWIRHPFYTAYNLTWIAGFVSSGWWPLAPIAILMAFLYERAARDEERGFLAGALAAEYREYRQRAGRYLPRCLSRAPRRLR
jgi:protein-S-isoprenylcysteine O-methyltransferase Ste14